MILIEVFLIMFVFSRVFCYVCFGIESGDNTVCSGHGECVSNDTCECTTSEDITYEEPRCLMESDVGQSDFKFDVEDSLSLFLGIPVSVAFVCVYLCCCSCLVYVIFFVCFVLCKRQKIQKEVDYLENFDFREDHQEYYNMQMEGLGGISEEDEADEKDFSEENGSYSSSDKEKQNTQGSEKSSQGSEKSDNENTESEGNTESGESS